MGTQRYISTSFWDDPWIVSLEPLERYLYMYLLTNPLTNIAGVYQIALRRIVFDTSLNEDRIRDIFQKFEKAGKAFFFKQEMVIIPSWPKHQKWETNGKIEKGIKEVVRELPDDILRFMKKTGYRYPVEEYIRVSAGDDRVSIGDDRVSIGDELLYSNLSYLDLNKIQDSCGLQNESENPETGPRNEAEEISTPNGVAPEEISPNDSSPPGNAPKADPCGVISGEIPQDGEKPPEIAPKADPCRVISGEIPHDGEKPPGNAPKAEIVPVSQSPPSKNSRKKDLTPAQMLVFREAKLCFESSEKARKIMYADEGSAKMHMENLKTLVIRCFSMSPGMSADFMRNVLEHFKTLANGRLKGKAVFTPRCLITPFIWEQVIDSLPENQADSGLRESIRSLFK